MMGVRHDCTAALSRRYALDGIRQQTEALGSVWIPVRLIVASVATGAATWGLLNLALHLLG